MEGSRIPHTAPAGEATFAYRLLKMLGTPLLKALFRVRGEGVGNVPGTGPLILAANHVSYLDPLVLSATCPRPVHYMMLREFYEKPFIGPLCRAAGSFPVDPGGPAAGALKRALSVLRQGKALGIFPEGGRSPDGSLRPARGGVALLAVRSGFPLLPAAIIGAEKAYPKAALVPRPYRVTVRYGTPLFFTRHGGERKRDYLDRVLAETMGAIAALSGRPPFSAR